MRLYHYTDARHVEPIRELGVVAHPAAFRELGIEGARAVWLTADDAWLRAVEGFGWRDERAKYTARVVVDVSVAETHVWRWYDLGPRLCAMAGGDLAELARYNERAGSADWWVYLRSIPRERIAAIETRA